MKENYLKIIFVIDESGSMQGTESDVVGGFNHFIEEQKKAEFGKITVSLYKFNSQWSRVVNDLPIDEIRPLTSDDYTPGGLTATTHRRHRGLKTKRIIRIGTSNMVIMVVITDGRKNAS